MINPAKGLPNKSVSHFPWKTSKDKQIFNTFDFDFDFIFNFWFAWKNFLIIKCKVMKEHSALDCEWIIIWF